MIDQGHRDRRPALGQSLVTTLQVPAAGSTETPQGGAAADPDPLPQSGPDPGPPGGIDPLLTLAAPGADALVQHFPDESGETGLVLAGNGGALCAYWQLQANDLERVRGSFPGGAGRPLPVVRLRRTRPGGGGDPVDETALRPGPRAGAGETRFQVAADHGRYVAELGLTNGDGGWLMLARSNELDNVSAVGVDLGSLAAAPRHPPDPSGPLTAGPAPVSASIVDPDPALVSASVADPEPALALGSAPPAMAVFPLVQVFGSPPWSAAAASGPAGPTPWYGPSAATRERADDRSPPRGWSAPLPDTSLVPAEVFPETPHRDGGAPPPPASVPRQRTLEGRPLRLPAAAPAQPEPTAPDTRPQGPLAPVLSGLDGSLAYGQAPVRPAGFQVEAQLVITGQAPPGTLVDLFGHALLIGPGGRFQLVVRVDDPAVLRLALALHPPPELTRSRDD